MSFAEKLSFIWDKAYTDALGAGLADPFAYADSKVQAFKRKLAAKS